MKIYYVPGMISLIALPCLIVAWQYQLKKEQQYVTEVIVARGLQHDDVYDQPPIRQYTTLELIGDPEENRIKLAYGELLIRQLHLENDTLNGIHFHFGVNCKYSDMVSTINIL